MDAKERITTYIKQFDTDAAIGMPVDRTRRGLLNRIHNLEGGKQAYSDLKVDGSIHEEGTGKPGSPIIVVLGPAKAIAPVVPQPWSFLSQSDITTFMLRMVDTYESNGWDQSLLDIRAEFKSALERYQPGRPY